MADLISIAFIKEAIVYKDFLLFILIKLMLVVQMVKASRGAFSRRTRKLKGKSTVSVASLVRTFSVGDRVIIDPKAKWIGMPHLRYASRHGTIMERRGKSYVVEVGDYNKKKAVVVGPVHLKLA